MIRSTDWREWLEGKIKFLWIHGIPGAGKTVLTSFLIEQVQAVCNKQNSISHQEKPSICVYYYCYFARNQDEAAPFLRWLVSQLCRQARLVPSELDQLFQLKHVPSISQLLDALQTILEEFCHVLVVIDAVDESQSREDLLKVLRDLATDHRFDKVRLLATSREYYDIEMSFLDISSPTSMANPVVEDDIRRYVHSALVSNRRFQNWPPSLVTEVEDKLATGAKGMFRWAVCQIDVLQRLGRQQDVKVAISNLPRTLDETYERIFQLLPDEDHQFVQSALVFICGNNDIRPLPIKANILLQAIFCRLESIFDKENDIITGNDILYNRDILRDRCGCLITLSKNGDTEDVTLAHYTVKEFLYSDRTAKSKVSYFALSDFFVRTAFLEMVLEVVVARHHETIMPDKQNLHIYCIVALETREIWPSIRDPIIRNAGLAHLAAKYDVMAGTVAYISQTCRAFKVENLRIRDEQEMGSLA